MLWRTSSPRKQELSGYWPWDISMDDGGDEKIN